MLILSFATLAARMERCVQGQSRDLVDQAYTKFVSVMLATLEKIAATDRKHGDVYLLENYAAACMSLQCLCPLLQNPINRLVKLMNRLR